MRCATPSIPKRRNLSLANWVLDLQSTAFRKRVTRPPERTIPRHYPSKYRDIAVTLSIDIDASSTFPPRFSHIFRLFVATGTRLIVCSSLELLGRVTLKHANRRIDRIERRYVRTEIWRCSRKIVLIRIRWSRHRGIEGKEGSSPHEGRKYGNTAYEIHDNTATLARHAFTRTFLT